MESWVSLRTTTVSKQSAQNRYMTEITVISCSDHHASPGNWKRSRLWASNSRPLGWKAATLTTTPASRPTLLTLIVAVVTVFFNTLVYLITSLSNQWQILSSESGETDMLDSSDWLNWNRCKLHTEPNTNNILYTLGRKKTSRGNAFVLIFNKSEVLTSQDNAAT